MLPTQLLVVLSAASADSFAAPGFCSVRLGTPPCDLLPAGHPPLQQVTLSDIPLLLARRLGAAVAGYTLTAKRERSLLASALLPPLPRHGLCATPIALPARGDPPHVLEQSLRRCDVIMHKATDQLAAPEVMPIAGRLAIARACHIYPPSHPNTLTPHALPCRPGGAAEVEALLACAAREGMPVLDPPRLLATVFDRVAIAAVLACMPPLLGGVPTRGPTTAEVQALDPGHVAAALAGAGITLPCLLKPRVACGTPKSHHFALLTSTSGAPAACVDVPAVAQAFVRHDGTAHKVYCFADQVLTQQRRSLPAVDAASPGVAGVVSFDALHALPTPRGRLHAAQHGDTQDPALGAGPWPAWSTGRARRRPVQHHPQRRAHRSHFAGHTRRSHPGGASMPTWQPDSGTGTALGRRTAFRSLAVCLALALTPALPALLPAPTVAHHRRPRRACLARVPSHAAGAQGPRVPGAERGRQRPSPRRCAVSPGDLPSRGPRFAPCVAWAPTFGAQGGPEPLWNGEGPSRNTLLRGALPCCTAPAAA